MHHGFRKQTQRTAAEAGWHISRYNLSAPIPGGNSVAIANLYKGSCAPYSSLELYLMSVLDDISEDHPIIDLLAKRGVIVNFDELAALQTLSRGSTTGFRGVGLTICPTLGCNFDCPYCFENHFADRMSEEMQDDIVKLADRMLEASAARKLSITWFGGEPLLAPDIIESLSKRLMELAEIHVGVPRAGFRTCACPGVGSCGTSVCAFAKAHTDVPQEPTPGHAHVRKPARGAHFNGRKLRDTPFFAPRGKKGRVP